MEAGEYGLTRGTCFVARRLEVVAVAGLLWFSEALLHLDIEYLRGGWPWCLTPTTRP